MYVHDFYRHHEGRGSYVITSRMQALWGERERSANSAYRDAEALKIKITCVLFCKIAHILIYHIRNKHNS